MCGQTAYAVIVRGPMHHDDGCTTVGGAAAPLFAPSTGKAVLCGFNLLIDGMGCDLVDRRSHVVLHHQVLDPNPAGSC
jgi:hypothetical protein